MKLHMISTGTFKLDGGATFGVIPKTLWSKVYPADENNLCTFALKLLVIETEERKILIDTGVGNKQGEDFFKYYYREGHHSLELALAEKGFTPEDITDVILTHLHFDHVGGAVKKINTGELIPALPKAYYYVSRKQWEWSQDPNIREKASYLPENILPLKEHNVLKFIDTDTEFLKDIRLRIFSGHTDGLLVPFIKYKDKMLVYTNDLLALSPQISRSWVCGYDTQPLRSMQERDSFLEEAIENNYTLIFQHDNYVECCTVKSSEKGPRIDKIIKFSEVL